MKRGIVMRVETVAKFFIGSAQAVGDCITNLKLQKLAYYAEAWHLALYDEPLTGAPFQAWIHGPVNPQLYSQYAEYGPNPISVDTEVPRISPEKRAHLEEVLDAYSQFSAWDLERMTHSEEPWLKARGNLPFDVPSNAVIDPNVMRDYYRSRIED